MNGRRTYRSLQGDGAAEVAAALDRVDGPHQCPECGHVWTGSSAPAAVPPAIAERSPVDVATRHRQLEPTATRLAAALRDALPEVTFGVWIAPLLLDDVIGDVVYIAAPPQIASWAATRYASLVAGAASRLAGRPMTAQIYASAPTSDATPKLGDLAGPPEGERAPAAARRPAADARDDDSRDAGTETDAP